MSGPPALRPILLTHSGDVRAATARQPEVVTTGQSLTPFSKDVQ